MKRTIHRICLVAALACAAVTFAAGAVTLWIDVPFVSQPKEGCGAAVISMVMQYWAGQNGKSMSPAMESATIQRVLYSPSQKGIFASAMRGYFEQNGYRALAFRGDWDELHQQLAKGRPLIVSLKAGGAHGPLHYVVVVGQDDGRGYVFLNDPAVGKMLRLSREGFESEWSLADNWTLLAVPAEK